MNLELDPIDYLPAYYLFNVCNRNRNVRNQRTSWITTIISHLLALIFGIVLCAGGYYYFHNQYLMMIQVEELNLGGSDPPPTPVSNQSNQSNQSDYDGLKAELERLNQSLNRYEADREGVAAALEGQQWNIQNQIDTALDIYDADKIGLFDYASSYAGGVVCSTPNTYAYAINSSLTILHFFRVELYSNPDAILQPMTLPGSCYAFQGTTGRIRIKLAKKIYVAAVTVDHTYLGLLDDYKTAPKDFEVYGLEAENSQSGKLLSKFTYNIEGRPYQTFATSCSVVSKAFYEFLEIQVLSNYGNIDYTCLYRFRVHNRLKPGLSCC